MSGRLLFLEAATTSWCKLWGSSFIRAARFESKNFENRPMGYHQDAKKKKVEKVQALPPIRPILFKPSPQHRSAQIEGYQACREKGWRVKQDIGAIFCRIKFFEIFKNFGLKEGWMSPTDYLTQPEIQKLVVTDPIYQRDYCQICCSPTRFNPQMNNERVARRDLRSEMSSGKTSTIWVGNVNHKHLFKRCLNFCKFFQIFLLKNINKLLRSMRSWTGAKDRNQKLRQIIFFQKL